MIRNTFVKLLPRRFTPDSEISSIGGNQYTTQWIDIEPEAVYQDRGGIEPVSLSFSWNNTTKTLTFTTTTAPDEDIFIDYPLRFCGEVVVYLQEDPVTPSGSIVRWEPRLTSNPSIPESASNMLNGVLSTSSTSISLNNNDYYLNKYLTKYDNYKNKPAVIYGQLGDAYKNLAYGYITRTGSGRQLRVSIKSTTKLLEAQATLNNTDEYINYRAANITNLPETLEGKPIPVCYGPLSQVPVRGRFQPTYLQESTPSYSQRYRLPPDSIVRKAEYLGNYKFLLGISDNPWSRSSFESIAVSYSSTTTYFGNTARIYNVAKEYIGYFVEGENWRFFDGGGGGTNVLIYFLDFANNQIWINGSTNHVTAAMFPSLMYRREPSRESTAVPGTTFNEILQGISFLSYPFFVGQPANALHQWTFEATDSGQYLLFFTYAVDDQTEFDTNGYDEWDHYFILQSKNIGQSDFIKKYIESTGSSVDTTSFSQAQTDADTDVLYTVNNDNKIQSVHEVVENIATSCNGILYLDTETNKYKYKIIESGLSGTDWTITAQDILEPDLIPIVSYEDTASTVRMDHPYTEGERVNFIDGNNSSRTSSFSRAFNAEERVKTLKHFLTDSSVVIDYKAETFNTPMVTYRFTVMADDFFDVDIGDIVEINNTDGRLLNSADSVRLLIIARNRSVEKIGLTGYEFEKIP
jgi:hypothetical protein